MPQVPPEVAATLIEAEMVVLGRLAEVLSVGAGVVWLAIVAAIGWLVWSEGARPAPRPRRPREGRRAVSAA